MFCGRVPGSVQRTAAITLSAAAVTDIEGAVCVRVSWQRENDIAGKTAC
jgi:hypothetical protein